MCFNGKIKHATEDNAKKKQKERKKLQIQIPENVMEKCVIEFSSDFSCMRHEHCLEDNVDESFSALFVSGLFVTFDCSLSLYLCSLIYLQHNKKNPCCRLSSHTLIHSCSLFSKLLQEHKDIFLYHFNFYLLSMLQCLSAGALYILMNTHQKNESYFQHVLFVCPSLYFKQNFHSQNNKILTNNNNKNIFCKIKHDFQQTTITTI